MSSQAAQAAQAEGPAAEMALTLVVVEVVEVVEADRLLSGPTRSISPPGPGILLRPTEGMAALAVDPPQATWVEAAEAVAEAAELSALLLAKSPGQSPTA